MLHTLTEPRREANPTHVANTRLIRLGGRVVAYRFRRARRHTIGLAIDRHGLTASAPRWVGVAEVETFIREKEAWILKKLAEPPLGSSRKLVWEEGARLAVLGNDVALRRDSSIEEPRLHGTALLLPRSADMRDATINWMRSTALALFRARIAAFAPILGVGAPSVSLSNARTQWGSCAIGAGRCARIRLHWRLIHFSRPIIDYVAAHELAHLKEMNHSPSFWRVVATLFPDYIEARRVLRAETHNLPEL